MTCADTGYTFVFSLLLAVCLWPGLVHVHGACHVRTQYWTFRPEGFEDYPMPYNVCIDNTTIFSQMPSTVKRIPPSFVRDCCGCMVSSGRWREFPMESLSRSRQERTFYFFDIEACQCIDCSSSHGLIQRMLYLKHRRR